MIMKKMKLSCEEFQEGRKPKGPGGGGL